jgi:5-methylcytosine-specific restriction endonuclease McrA
LWVHFGGAIPRGSSVGNVHPSRNFSRTEIGALPLWNRDIETAYSKRKWAELSSLNKAEKDKEDKAWWDRYEAHRQSPKWKALRKKVIERAQGICEGCGHNRATQAHHLTYDRVCDEMLFDLVAVCESCHSKVHRKKPTFTDEAEEDYHEGAPLY